MHLNLQKVKELTYMHSEGILAGELKHGPLALIDEAMPLLMVVVRDPVYKVTCFFVISLSTDPPKNVDFSEMYECFATSESKECELLKTLELAPILYANNWWHYKWSYEFNWKGNPIVICNKGDDETKKHAYKTIEIPQTVDCLQGILCIIPLQLLSLHIAELRNCDVSWLWCAIWDLLFQPINLINPGWHATQLGQVCDRGVNQTFHLMFFYLTWGHFELVWFCVFFVVILSTGFSSLGFHLWVMLVWFSCWLKSIPWLSTMLFQLKHFTLMIYNLQKFGTCYLLNITLCLSWILSLKGFAYLDLFKFYIFTWKSLKTKSDDRVEFVNL